MRLFDLHCDTLYRSLSENKTLFEDSFQLSIDKRKKFSEWIQCMAVWIPDKLTADDGLELFRRAYKKLKHELKNKDISIIKNAEQFKESNNCAVMFTVENGAFIDGNIERIYELAQAGVKILTLTWNGANSIGDGAGVAYPKGITDFGRQAITVLENCNIVIDVSHASKPLFYDVAELAKKPFIATHSNSYTCTPHKRNLTNDQFAIIKNRGGIVGINFCSDFLNDNRENACINDIIRHTEHFLSLGGENTVSFGSDFDGCDVPSDIGDIDGISKLYNEFLRLNYSEELLDKLFFTNAHNFFVDYFDI